MAAVTVTLVGFFAFLILRVTAPQMTPLFTDLSFEDSASIVLKVRGALEPQQVRAIRHLVAAAVNGLKPERVSVVDEAGRLLADGAKAEEGTGLGAEERQASYERRLREQVDTIVSSVV